MKKCPYCGSEDLFFDPIMRNYICEDCDKLFEPDELEE
jgi:DNA-directed RNA polymerase subunit RPC12/RpoP